MSEEIGFVAVEPSEQAGPLLPGVREVAEATQQLIDAEVRRIIEEAHAEVRNLLERERERLDSLAEALLESETLDQDDAYAAAGTRGAAGQRPRVTADEELIRAALAEDVGAGDLTSRAVVPDGARARATVIAKAPGVVAGLGVAGDVFETVDPAISVERLRSDGDRVTPATPCCGWRGRRPRS